MPVLTRDVYRPVSVFAAAYGIGTTKAYELTKMEGFPMKRIGPRCIRVNMSKVEEWLDKQAQNY